MGHVIWTMEDLAARIPVQPTFWISNCRCREGEGSTCKKGLHVCLGFEPDATSTRHGLRTATPSDVHDLLAFARRNRLVPRPWIGDDGTMRGSCFCCDCCCGYILDDDGNVAGPRIQVTDLDLCTGCGVCIESCYFKARALVGGELSVDDERCYGCGLCVDDCAFSAISMVPRKVG